MKKTFKSITSYLRGLFLFPYYSYKSYKILKNSCLNHKTQHNMARIPAIGSDFKDYILNHDMQQVIKSLKNGLDELSAKHVDFMIEAIMNFPSAKYKDFFYNDNIIKYYPEWLRNEAVLAEAESKKLWGKGFWGGYECVYYKHGINLLPQKAQDYVKNKIFLDMGAFDGDSAYLLSTCNPSKILSFEISSKNIEKYKHNLNKKGVNNYEIFRCALSNKVGSMNFDDNGTWSDTVVQGGKDTVEVNTLDNFVVEHGIEKIGFIKADIESEEPNMLKGAIETLKRDRPVLALSIYHDPISFFEIKKFLEGLNLNYKFIIRVMGFYECGPINEANLIAYPAEYCEN